MTKRIALLATLLLVISGCATRDDLNQSNRRISEEAIRVDDVFSQLKMMELQRQEVATNMAKLELQGLQNGNDYQTLSQRLANIEKSQSSYLERLSSLEKQGRISSEQYQKFQQYVQQERQKQSGIMKRFNDEWNAIGHK